MHDVVELHELFALCPWRGADVQRLVLHVGTLRTHVSFALCKARGCGVPEARLGGARAHAPAARSRPLRKLAYLLAGSHHKRCELGCSAAQLGSAARTAGAAESVTLQYGGVP